MANISISRFSTLIFTSLRGIVLFIPFILHLLIADLALSLLLPISLLNPDAVYHASSRIAASVWSHIQSIFETRNSAPIYISGETPPGQESAIVVANHNAWSDFYMIQAVAQRAEMLDYCRWFAKAELKNVPLLGWGLWAMDMPLVTRNWTTDRAELQRVFSGPVERKWPVWLVSFSEATRFTKRKYEKGVGWCEANGRPIMQHVLYPRFKGWVATVGELRKAEQVKAVYDFTIAYARKTNNGKQSWSFMEAPDIWTTLAQPNLGDEFCFWVHVRRFELGKLPHDGQELEKWLESRWVEKGEMLERLNVQVRTSANAHKLRLE